MTTELQFDAYAKDELDPELMLVADYMGGLLSAADEKAFEQRMIDDERFFLRMAPFLAPWAEPESLPMRGEIGAPVEAPPVALPRADDVEIRRRQTNRHVAIAASAAFQIKILLWLATTTAAGLVVAYRLERPAASAPQQIFVHLPPTVAHDSAPRVVAQTAPAHIERHTVRAHHVPVTDAAQSIEVVPLPAPVDSATERAVAEMVARSLPEGEATPSVTTKPVETGPAIAWVPRIWVEADTSHSVAREIKDALATGVRGVVAFIAWPIDFVRRHTHHDPKP